jgi:hypothetical protein
MISETKLDIAELISDIHGTYECVNYILQNSKELIYSIDDVEPDHIYSHVLRGREREIFKILDRNVGRKLVLVYDLYDMTMEVEVIPMYEDFLMVNDIDCKPISFVDLKKIKNAL